MKKRVIRVCVLVIVFAAALVVSSIVINRGTDDEIVDMGAPTLPRISFTLGGVSVNSLSGYVEDMDITAMRDTLTPLSAGGTLTVDVEAEGNDISAVRYEVYSLDGKDRYIDGDAAYDGDTAQAVLDVGTALSGEVPEAVLKVTLTADGRAVSYYTRIVSPENLTASVCLDYAMDFHDKAIRKEETEEIDSHLEPGEESDNTTYQTVNIHSNVSHVQWGDLSPEVVGDVEWSIQESNTVYTSILAKYQVSCRDENGDSAFYNVKEFFRVRVLEDAIYLLDYDREMEEVFRGLEQNFDEDGILFGIMSPDDIRYMTADDGAVTAFVQARNLWLYDRDDNELTQVFSFADQEGRDMRSKNDRHAVRVISMDESGNLSFIVCGYMNRGPHEGEVGVAVYYFDAAAGVVEEQAFIPSTKSYPIALDELGRMVYYDHGTSMLYVLADGTLHQVGLEDGEQKVLAEGLTEDEYAVSDDGHLMAYVTGAPEDGKGTNDGVCVMNLKTGSTAEIRSEKGEGARPLGFINGDFIFGRFRPEDAGVTVSGEEVSPMYEIEIRDAENETEATYAFSDQGIYTYDIQIQENQVTLDRVQKDGDVYDAAPQEYITNNQERKDRSALLEMYTTRVKESQVRMTLDGGTGEEAPDISRPGQVVTEEPLTLALDSGSGEERFYVYGKGELLDICERAGDAVQLADEVSGVVVSSDQQYIWERGNRDLVYSTEAEPFRAQGKETSLEACERYMESYEAHQIDLTGCTLEQVLYVVNQGCPVIALTGEEEAVLLTGYTTSDVTYIDPEDGDAHTASMANVENRIEKGGSIFLGFIR